MKKKKRIKRKLCSILVTTMLTAAMTGCGQDKASSEESILNEAEKNTNDYIYKTEVMDIEGLDVNNVRTVNLVGDRIYAADYGLNGNIHIWSFDADGNNVRTCNITASDSDFFQYLDFDLDGNSYLVHTVYSYTENGEYIDSDGYAGANYSDYEDQEQFYLEKYDQNGNQIYQLNLKENVQTSDYFYVYDMEYTDKYGVLISSSEGILKYDEADGIQTIIDKDTESNYSNSAFNIAESPDGQVFVYVSSDSHFICAPLDVDNKAIGEESQAMRSLNNLNIFCGKGKDLYVCTNKEVYGYDHEKDELVKLLDYNDSDMNINYPLYTMIALSENELFAVVPVDDINFNAAKLIKVPADQVVNKTVITLGTLNIDYSIKKKIIEFNQNSSDYKVKIVDYSTYNSDGHYDRGDSQFNLDIASGNVPDIMVFPSDFPIDNYINKGLFYDLGQKFEKDEDVSYDMFLTNVIDAFKTGDNLYTITPSFKIITSSVKTSKLNGKDYISVEDLCNMVDSNGLSYDKSMGFLSRQEVLERGITFYGSDFIDWENKTCNFNSDEFVTFLEFTNKFPEKLADDIWANDFDAMYREDEAIVRYMYLNGFDIYQEERYGVFGEDISFAGFPSVFGENCSVISPNQRIAVSAKTKNTDGCWEFIKTLLSEEYQDSLSYEFPIRKSSLEKKAEAATQTRYRTDENGNQVEDVNYYYIGNEEVELPTLKKEEVDKVMDFITSVDSVYTFNSYIMNIITEEASAYYSGQKTAKDVADIIQSRLSIYVKEIS